MCIRDSTHLWLFHNIILELQKEQPELFGTENVRMMRELLEELSLIHI